MDLRRLGVSTSAFGYAMGSTGKKTPRANPHQWTLEEFIEHAHQWGFGGVEAPLMRFVPDLDPARIERIRTMLVERDMFFILDAEEALNIEQIKTLLPWARTLNSPIIRVKSSTILGCDRARLGQPWSEHVKQCIATLNEIAPLVREYGIPIAVENHQDLDSADLLAIQKEVGADVMGVTFDIGNAFATCEDPLAMTHTLGTAIYNVHLKDYVIGNNGESFLLARTPLGHGLVDFPTILPIIAAQVPNVKMVVELGALEARAVAYKKEGFWDQIIPRNPAEIESFTQFVSHHALPVTSSLQTPWERGESGESVVAYEVDQLNSSLSYLRSL